MNPATFLKTVLLAQLISLASKAKDVGCAVATIPGGVVTIIAELGIGIVMMFVSLFMIDAVYTAIALNNSSVFWGVSTSLVTLVATLFSVIGLVLIVVALSTAMGAMKSMAS